MVERWLLEKVAVRLCAVEKLLLVMGCEVSGSRFVEQRLLVEKLLSLKSGPHMSWTINQGDGTAHPTEVAAPACRG